MRRLLRWFLNSLGKALCLLSLLACLAAAWLWGRQPPQNRPPRTLRVGATSYTLRADAAGLSLTRPPPGLTAAAAARAVALARRLDNRYVEWFCVPATAYFSGKSWTGPRRLGVVYAADAYWEVEELSDPGFAEAAGPLLAALEDPRRSVAAHYMLSRRSGWQGDCPVAGGGDRVEVSLNGLRIELRPTPAAGPSGESWSVGPVADASQAAGLRDLWHRRLDVPVASATYPRLIVLLAAGPLLWLAVRCRRLYVTSARRRRGLCLCCGYDLTGSTGGRCSECGKGIDAVKADGRVTA